jgi:hypothetical protein
MAAHFYCWEPSFWLNPYEPNFEECVIDLLTEHPRRAASPRVRGLLDELEVGLEDRGAYEAVGEFLDYSVDWPYYHDAGPVIVEAAQRHGLHCYDQHAEKLHPTILN